MNEIYLDLTFDDEDDLFFVSEALYDLAVSSEDSELSQKLHLISIRIATMMLGAHERRNVREGL